MAKQFTFHESGREFVFDVPSRTVTNEYGVDIAYGCFNLEQARRKTRAYIESNNRKPSRGWTDCPTCGSSLLTGDHRDCAI